VDGGEFGESGEGAPASSGGSLLDFHWADVAFGLIVVPRRRMRPIPQVVTELSG
jgi:hypothetical protein